MAPCFDYYRARLHKYVAAHDGSDEGFKLKAEDCMKLQLEALQYHHRYICLLQLEDYARGHPRCRSATWPSSTLSASTPSARNWPGRCSNFARSS